MSKRITSPDSPKGMRQATWEAMGCAWTVQVWDAMSDTAWDALITPVREVCLAFDATFSRFKKTSLIWQLADRTGEFAVPRECVELLRIYQRFFRVTEGKFTPLIGHTISDLGYDAEYSLTPRERIRLAPALDQAIAIVDDERIIQHVPCLLDMGGLGKGYMVDRLAEQLKASGVEKGLVNGSGDILFWSNDDTSARVGLEHPEDASQVIGVVELRNQALCGSSGNRRRWRTYHHIIDPFTQTSPNMLLASWVKADTAVMADGLATALFLTDPARLQAMWAFEYACLTPEHQLIRSSGFGGEVYT
ncbi:MAG: FAD:protein transferase [Patescibacteria group bacterium]|nr:FAD:protein transferase [Patescibacteria group bacterium]